MHNEINSSTQLLPVYLSSYLAILLEGGDEAAQAYLTAIGEQLRYFRHSTNVLLPILLAEAEVAIQTAAHIVTVQAIRRNSVVHENRLHLERDGGLPGARQTRQPYRASPETADATDRLAPLRP